MRLAAIRNLRISFLLGLMFFVPLPRSDASVQLEPRPDVIYLPFRLVRETREDDGLRIIWRAAFFVEKEHMDKRGLERLFSAYSRLHTKPEEDLEIVVFTSMEGLSGKHPVALSSEIRGGAEQQYVARFSRERHLVLSGVGKNEWYSLYESADRREAPMTVVMRGKQPFAHELVSSTEDLISGYVRLNAVHFRLKGMNPTDGYVRLRSQQGKNSEWHSIVTVQRKRDTPLSVDQVKIVSNKIAYFFFDGVFVVTTDRGYSWRLWEATDFRLNGRFCENAVIENVFLDVGGAGKMVLDVDGDGRLGFDLETTDYGRNWSLP